MSSMGNRPLIFRVVLDPPQQEYRVGQTLRGYVHLHLVKNMDVSNMSVFLLGIGGSDTNTFENGLLQPGAYRYEENYLYCKLTLVGKEEDEDAVIEHQSGEFRYHFACDFLSNSMPSSFQGEFGSVRYFCKAVLKRPGKKNLTSYTPFTYTRDLDLRRDRRMQMPVHVRRPLPVGWCGISVGKLSYMLHINKKGFIPGEEIVINATVTNRTTFGFRGSTMKLVQTQEFLNGSRWENAKWSRVLMKRMHQHRISPGDTDSWTEERIRVPDVTDSHLYGCYSIDVSYALTFRAGPKYMPEVSAPIVIGTKYAPLSSSSSRIFTTDVSIEAGHLPGVPSYADVFKMPSNEDAASTFNVGNSIVSGPVVDPNEVDTLPTRRPARGRPAADNQEANHAATNNAAGPHIAEAARRLAGFPAPSRPRYVGDEVYRPAPASYAGRVQQRLGQRQKHLNSSPVVAKF